MFKSCSDSDACSVSTQKFIIYIIINSVINLQSKHSYGRIKIIACQARRTF